MRKIEIKIISITDLKTDAIVNAANSGLWPGGGVRGAIFKAAGYKDLENGCQKIGHCFKRKVYNSCRGSSVERRNAQRAGASV